MEKCHFPNCTDFGIILAIGKNAGFTKSKMYCELHSKWVVDQNSPEYYETCPNCGCNFGAS